MAFGSRRRFGLARVRRFELETLDIRATTLGINLLDCADPDLESTCEKVYAKIVHHARELVALAESVENDHGVPIASSASPPRRRR